MIFGLMVFHFVKLHRAGITENNLKITKFGSVSVMVILGALGADFWEGDPTKHFSVTKKGVFSE